MKVHFQRFTALFLVLVVSTGLLVLPAGAEDAPVSSTGTFWGDWSPNVFDFIGKVAKQVISAVDTDYCPVSDDHRHHGKVIGRPTGPLPAPDNAWKAKCDDCSQNFIVYDDSLQNAYNEHVNKVQESLGTVQVGTDGIYIMPTLDWSDAVMKSNTSDMPDSKFQKDSVSLISSDNGYSINVISTVESLSKGRYLSLPSKMIWPSSSVLALYGSGTLYFVRRSSVLSFQSFSVTNDSRLPEDFGIQFFPSSADYSNSISPGFSPLYCLPGWHFRDDYGGCCRISFTGTGNIFSVNITLVPFCVRFVPDSWSINDFTSPVGGSGGRVGSISGNFGYYVNGDLVTVENTTIVDETNNTYTNPETGATSPVTNWTYDYSDRSYHLTLESGDTVNVTYGDENVTIKEGDTTYNIYYIVQGGDDTPTPSPSPTPIPSPSPSPDVPKHKYTSVVTTEPTCLMAGLRTYTCSECGDTYTEKIPATGHTWVVERVVNTVYDPVYGTLITQGYTIYQCSVCGEQYKDENGAGPPDGGSGGDDEEGGGFLDWLGKKLGELLGSIGEGIIGLLQTALGKILDGLIAIVNMISEKLNTVVEAIFKVFDEIPSIFTGFTDFMSAVFAFVPPEIITIITFGILAVVLVAIIKKFIN